MMIRSLTYACAVSAALSGARAAAVDVSTAAVRKAPSEVRRAATRSALPDLKLSFQKFCGDWMRKLQVREADNLARMHWETESGGVHGSYVGYAQEYTCTLGEGHDPVGTVRYREFRYEKHGGTIAEAEANSPLPIEVYDTREYFSYIRGKWDY